MSAGRARTPLATHGGTVVVCASLAAAAFAQTPLPQPRPITREWTCDNGRTVLVNYHPRRIREPAWLTYLGNRVEVTRKRVASGIAATSADGKVTWREQGKSAELEFDGLLDHALHCELGTGAGAKKPNP
jgi:membrane-bound inhibitor of C-type lysozyme